MLNNISEKLQLIFSFKPNKNQLRDIERLFFEIMRRENIRFDEIINYLKNNPNIEKYGGRNKFFAIKNSLIKRRYPLLSARRPIDAKNIYLNKMPDPLPDNIPAKKPFIPSKIFVENQVKSSYLVKNFSFKFPEVTIEELDSCSSYLKKNKFSIAKLKEPVVFLIKEKWDFLKACPCTKNHLRCGYWILNLGFGCPFDCSYCFLQCYANFPGITLPANIDDFFEQFDKLYKQLKNPIRIGTGEFCDSLALDEITQYSKKLIPYFSGKNVFFELKTKSSEIKNLLSIKPSKNIVISWSLNPQSIIGSEELLTASLNERIDSASKIQKYGYNVGFHFDPIIFSENWENLYREVIEKIYAKLTPPLAWISLGTLRSHRKLKIINEQRFPKSSIFYEELLLSEDKKLRYPQFIRDDIYKKMIKWIRKYDTKTPVYLCMESKETWKMLDKTDSNQIESSLINRPV